MNLLKRTLVFIVLIELLLAIVLITEESLNRLDYINTIFLFKNKNLNVKVSKDSCELVKS